MQIEVLRIHNIPATGTFLSSENINLQIQYLKTVDQFMFSLKVMFTRDYATG